ncbi:MAG: GNAT family N-acetyltransferase [Thermotogota bacterium]
MVRKIDTGEQERAREFVIKEPEYNLFMVGNLESFSLDDDFLDVWVEEKNGEIIAILCRYFKAFIFYAIDDYDVDNFIEILNHYNYELISGKDTAVEKFTQKLDNIDIDEEFFCVLRDLKALDFSNEKVENFEVKDFDLLFNLRKRIDEFKETNYDQHKNKFLTNTGRAKIIKKDDEIIATAETSAENSKSAMITGVATQPEFRGKGYASKLVYELCSDLLSENISPCLFYDNPSAGNIYKKLGFEEIGKYLLIFNDKK